MTLWSRKVQPVNNKPNREVLMNWNTARAMLAGGAIVGGALLLTGCPATKGDAPEPTGDNIKPGTHTRVIQMPNGFRNIAATCEGRTGIYVTSRGIDESAAQPSSVALLPNDPACAK